MTEVIEIARREIIKVVVGATVGTTLEWYDFFVATFAATLVWPYTHLPPENPATAVAASIAAFGAIYFARPIGAFIFGHFGDKMGRKNVMVWTLVIMGLGTLGISLTPDYASIGIWAIILITLFRLIQGFGLGGEWGGAATWVSEFYASRSKWRALPTSLISSTTGAGLALGSLTFYLLLNTMSRAYFLSFGWRIAFYIGFIIAIIGAIIRWRLLESPLFVKALQKKEILKLPAVTVLKERLGRVLLLALAWNYSVSLVIIILFTYATTFIPSVGLPAVVGTIGLFIYGSIAVIVCVFGGYLADIIGRKWTMFISALSDTAFSYPFFILMLTKDILLIYLSYAIFSIANFIGYGVVPAYLTENFETKYRYSGSGLSYQIGGILTGIGSVGLLPFIIATIGNVVNAWPYVALLGIGFGITSIITIPLLKETKGTELR